MSKNDFIDPDQLALDVSFFRENLSEAFSNQAALFSFYGGKAHDAQKEADKSKIALEIMEARIDKEIREDMIAEGTKVTEKMVENAIKRDSRYQKAQMRLVDAKHIAGLCRTAVDAFAHRRDMLVQSGADVRKDMEGSMRMHGATSADMVSSARADHQRSKTN